MRGEAKPPSILPTTGQARFQKFCCKIRNSHRTPAQQIKNALFSEAAYTPAGLEKIPQVFWCRLINRGRSDERKLRENPGNFFKGSCKFRVLFTVFRRNARDAASGLGYIVIKKQCAPIRRGRKHARVRPQNFAIKFLNL